MLADKISRICFGKFNVSTISQQVHTADKHKHILTDDIAYFAQTGLKRRWERLLLLSDESSLESDRQMYMKAHNRFTQQSPEQIKTTFVPFAAAS